LSSFSATLIRLIIEAQDLSDEQRRTVYKFLALHTQAYVNSRNFPAADLELVGAFIEHVEKVYDVALMSANVGSLEIVIHCPTLESLEHLWSDYLSGHLNEVAETFLITDEIKRMLKLETIRLKTTIEEENYLRCRKALVEMSGEFLAKFIEFLKAGKSSLRKQPTFREVATSVLAKRRPSNERRNSLLMTCTIPRSW